MGLLENHSGPDTVLWSLLSRPSILFSVSVSLYFSMNFLAMAIFVIVVSIVFLSGFPVLILQKSMKFCLHQAALIRTLCAQ